MVDVTVITPSLPVRRGLLVEAVASVQAQTVPVAHLIDADPTKPVGAKRNELMSRADTEWVAFLDDDDLLDPHHIETLLGHDADVVVPHCRFLGPPMPPTRCCAGYYNRPYDRQDLRQHGIFPITVLARRDAVLDVGGFGEGQWEDWELWNAMADARLSFVVVPVVTWSYRTKGRVWPVSRAPRRTAVQRLKAGVARRAPGFYDRLKALRA